jgi:hypothetical protein
VSRLRRSGMVNDPFPGLTAGANGCPRFARDGEVAATDKLGRVNSCGRRKDDPDRQPPRPSSTTATIVSDCDHRQPPGPSSTAATIGNSCDARFLSGLRCLMRRCDEGAEPGAERRNLLAPPVRAGNLRPVIREVRSTGTRNDMTLLSTVEKSAPPFHRNRVRIAINATPEDAPCSSTGYRCQPFAPAGWLRWPTEAHIIRENVKG